MCRKANLEDIRYALSDYCEEVGFADEDLELEDLLARFEDPRLDRPRRQEDAEAAWQ